jgi:hypothetical protein
VTATALVRMVLAVLLAAGLAYLGGLILGEYTFEEGYLPILGGFGLGWAVAGLARFVAGSPTPLWVLITAGILAVAGELVAVRIDTDGGDWPWQAWAALAAAAGAGFWPALSAWRRPAGPVV